MNIKPPHHDRLRDYDALHVQQLWEDAIELDVDLSACDPYRALNNDKYKIAIGQATKVISAARRKRDAHFRKEDMYTQLIAKHSEHQPMPNRRYSNRSCDLNRE